MMAKMATFVRLFAVLTALFCTVKAQTQDPTTYFNGEENDAYLDWLQEASYDRSSFLPSPAGNSTGTALHWTIHQGDEIVLAMAAKATAWIGFGIGEAGG